MQKHNACLLAAALLAIASGPATAQDYREEFRPQFHFTPAMNWMNDPNGLLYYNGTFNLFYQYNPSGNNWGNMSWGHAAGPDLLHWQQLPIALQYQTNVGGQVTQMYFSGSAVADTANTSGFGSHGKSPLVAIYTSYFPINIILPNGKFVLGSTQAQSLAYSTDNGLTWTQYAGNPVIPVPPGPYASQYQNFRDPKVFWYAPGNKWVMVASLAALHKVMLLSSPDLKHWTRMSEFGPANAIGGVWECPDLFELPVDGAPGTTKWVLMLGLNPGSIAPGSGTQYILGQFDGTRFTADSVNDPGPPPGIVVQDFEAPSFAATGWTATGDLVGAGPAPGAIGGQQAVTGYHGRFLVNTFINGDATQGTLTSPGFVLSKPYLNFLIGGGYHPYMAATHGTPADTQTGVNLLIGGKVVATATGANLEHLVWHSWNVASYRGKTAQIEIVDHNSGGWGHINVDDFVMSDVPKYEANWVDYGPDFYAANSWNGVPANYRAAIAWMNNWNYGGNIPTTPWRSAMSLPRRFTLKVIDDQVRLVQQPIPGLSDLWGAPLYVSSAPTTLSGGTKTAPVGHATGRTLDISAQLEPGTASDLGLKVRMGTNGDQTAIGYNPRTQEVYLDRFSSGDTGFDATFPGRYTAPLKLPASGVLKLRILVDWSSVEVFAGEGEAVLTAQIFPDPASVIVGAYATGGSAVLDSIAIHPVRSIWTP